MSTGTDKLTIPGCGTGDIGFSEGRDKATGMITLGLHMPDGFHPLANLPTWVPSHWRVDWRNYDLGCCCFGCTRLHAANVGLIASANVAAGYGSQTKYANFPMNKRIAAMQANGWPGTDGMYVDDGWSCAVNPVTGKFVGAINNHGTVPVPPPLPTVRLTLPGPAAVRRSIPAGYTCKKCNQLNEYAGDEHLSSDGTYTCYGCKP